MTDIEPARGRHHSQIVDIWHAGWHDAHAALVPAEILAFRKRHHFDLWLTAEAARFDLALDGDIVLGFVAVSGNELLKLYVGADWRGTGVAAALLRHAEAILARRGQSEMVLHCTAGNDRAHHFYEKHGWRLSETLSAPLWLPDPALPSLSVPTWKFSRCPPGQDIDRAIPRGTMPGR